MPRDALEKNPELTGLSLNTVREQLELCKARRKILILDMCHSGGKGGDEMSAATDKQIDDSAGMVTISSCKLREKSYEWPEVGHSAFIYHLLEALKQPAVADADKDGYLSVNELYTKVHQDVRRWAARYGGKEQTPKLAQEVEGQIVVARAPRGAPVVVEDLKTTATLRVTSTPSGAEVYIGGALQGRTPCEVTIDLGAQEQASLEVIVQQTGYRSKGGRVTVRRGQAAPWNVELERLPTDPVPPGPPVTPPPSRPADYEFVPIPAGDGVAAFELGKYEVTVGQFRKFVEATGYKTTPEKEGY
ncbi:MAG: PEGA domain-containing protein, partial [Armatimonadetes bacterium]|nr:PEGA domain-containing protein [Armatimonadota bacterium]